MKKLPEINTAAAVSSIGAECVTYNPDTCLSEETHHGNAANC
jgi:hypothetical protein